MSIRDTIRKRCEHVVWATVPHAPGYGRAFDEMEVWQYDALIFPVRVEISYWL